MRDAVADAVVESSELRERLGFMDSAVTETENMRTFHVEWKFLQWEHARLMRELRGMQVLFRILQGRCGREASVLPTESVHVSAGSSTPVCASLKELAEENASLRTENSRLSRELRGIEVLVSKASSGKAHCFADTCRADAFVSGAILGMPGDGSCLFHSLAHGLAPTSASELRSEIADFIETCSDTVISGQPIRDWILWESGDDPRTYGEAMRLGGEWGGALEMAVCAHIKDVKIHVYRKIDRERFQRICAFNAGNRAAPSVLSVLFRPGHYDVLEVK